MIGAITALSGSMDYAVIGWTFTSTIETGVVERLHLTDGYRSG